MKCNNSGQTIAEYILIMGLVAVALVVLMGAAVKKGFREAFNTYKYVLMVPYPYR